MERIRVDIPQIPRTRQTIASGALEVFREPGHAHFSPLRFRQFFGIGLGELERTLRAPLWLLRLEPDDPVVRLRVMAFLRVHSELIDPEKDPITAAFQLRNPPIQALRHQRLFDSVRDGRVTYALGYLESISTDSWVELHQLQPRPTSYGKLLRSRSIR